MNFTRIQHVIIVPIVVKFGLIGGLGRVASLWALFWI